MLTWPLTDPDKMENNPLLAMLKNAANGPPVSQSPATKPVSPPPSIQAVSIDDLFKSISGNMPPPNNALSPPSAPSAPPATAGGSAPGHQAKLLGVLGGSTPDGASRPISGLPTPSTDENRRRASLLNVLKSCVSFTYHLCPMSDPRPALPPMRVLSASPSSRTLLPSAASRRLRRRSKSRRLLCNLLRLL